MFTVTKYRTIFRNLLMDFHIIHKWEWTTWCQEWREKYVCKTQQHSSRWCKVTCSKWAKTRKNDYKRQAKNKKTLSLLLLLGSSRLSFILKATSVKEDRSQQRNMFCLWTEIICLLFYSWWQKLNHRVLNVHMKGLKKIDWCLITFLPTINVARLHSVYCCQCLRTVTIAGNSRDSWSPFRDQQSLQCCSYDKVVSAH